MEEGGDREIQEGTEQAVGGGIGWEGGESGHSVHVSAPAALTSGERLSLTRPGADDLFNIFNII